MHCSVNPVTKLAKNVNTIVRNSISVTISANDNVADEWKLPDC